MPAFTSAEEVYRYIGGIFETAFADPELQPRLAATGLVLKMVTTDPDSALLLDLAGSRTRGDAADADCTAMMTLSSATANGYWQGKVNLPFAMAKGQVRIDGPVAQLLKLAPLSRKLFPVYVETLRRDGREDLIV